MASVDAPLRKKVLKVVFVSLLLDLVGALSHIYGYMRYLL